MCIRDSLTSALILHDEGDKEEKKDKVDAYKEGKIDLVIVYSCLLYTSRCV